MYKSGLGYEVGDGRCIKFWEDVWCRERSLREEFSDIFALASDLGSSVAAKMKIRGEDVVWNPNLRRNAYDWEIPKVVQLLQRLQGARILLGEVDRRVCRKGVEGAFSVRSCYEHVVAVVEASGPWKVIWYSAVPLKAQFSLWTASLKKISTMNMLQRKGFYLPSICLLCY